MSYDSSRSANTGGKSKRSFKSNSSNPSEGSNHNNKKRKKANNQKTLGMSWGANSLSSSNFSSRNSPFADFGSYMVEKNRKLRNQFDAGASNSSLGDSNSGKSLFHGVSIFVDGFTIPSSQELRGYMLKYGGRFENYFSRHHVTHIICSNLPDSKMKNLRSFSGGLPVVKPTWISDSVAANKLLSWVPYQIDQLLKQTHNQQKLSAFFPLKSNSSSEDVRTPANCQIIPEAENPSSKGGLVKYGPLSEVGGNCGIEFTGETGFLHCGNSSKMTVEEPKFTNEKISEARTAEDLANDVEDENSVRDSFDCSPHRLSTLDGCYLDNHKTKGSSSSTIAGPSNQCHSTVGDPNFVENYFKNSRLHFIGTWRNRYRKRFPSLLNGAQYNNHNHSISNFSQKTTIIHIDMDCFFVSVIVRNHPELQDKPVAVCHSDSPRGTAEISSANYPARDYGVRAGIFVRDAKALCPHLLIFPYNFKAYEEVADQFYDILHKHCRKVQAVSCDEAFLDVTELGDEDPECLSAVIRHEIVEQTGCTASAGIAGSMLMARLATRAAKPNGQCHIPQEKVDDYLKELPIGELPGIGHVLEEKLKKQSVITCGQLRLISKESLQRDFGKKTGDMLWNYSRGIDNRLLGLVQETKSIGAEVNWGVRFSDIKDSQSFLANLSKEVALRLQGCGVQGRTITLKVKKRRKGAGEPVKYMGCGDCENLSHSITVPIATDDVDVLCRISKQLFGSFHIDFKEIRGIGLQVSRLESADMVKQGHERSALRSWLASALSSTGDLRRTMSPPKVGVDQDCGRLNFSGSYKFSIDSNSTDLSRQLHPNKLNGEACLNQVSLLPPICHLDMGVLESLPPEIFSEINEMYGGELINFAERSKDKNEKNSSCLCMSRETAEGVRNEGKNCLPSCSVDLDNTLSEDAKRSKLLKIQPVSTSGQGSLNLDVTIEGADKIDLMPASLSQVDISVLQQLPEELKADVLEFLPMHRGQASSSNSALDPVRENLHDARGMDNTENNTGLFPYSNLWIGNPPEWVEKFKVSDCLILNVLAEKYEKSGLTGNLSAILQSTILESQLSLDTSDNGWDEAICAFCELLKQYIELKIESDVEEIYICFRLLRRFMTKSKVFLQVYDIVLPFLQASVSENYGGSLHLSNAE